MWAWSQPPMGTAVGCQQPRAPIPGVGSAASSGRLQTARLRGNSPRFRGEEPVNETLHRLIGSSVVVGPASVSHRHERPLSEGRQPTERDIEAAAVGEPATSQGGIWIRIASFRSSRRTRASARSLLPVWPGAPCACWPTRRCCQVGTPPPGAIGPNFRGTHGCCRTVLGAQPQAKTPGASGACPLGGAWPPTVYNAAETLPSSGRLTGPQECEAAHHAWWRRAKKPQRRTTRSARCVACRPPPGTPREPVWCR